MNENVNVCITPKGDKPVLHFSQFDNERVFTVTVLADDGESAAVLTGLDIEFRLRKTDSHVVTIAPESVADNVITFKTTKQLCACCGQNIATVTLMKDDLIISTLDILVDIQRDILSGGLTSESDIRNLTTQIEQIVPEVVGDDYYNKQEVDDLLAEHTFDPSNYYNKSAVDGLLADKADSDDVYTKSDVDNLLMDRMGNIEFTAISQGSYPIISFNSSYNAPVIDIDAEITASTNTIKLIRTGVNLWGHADVTIESAAYVINNEDVCLPAGTYTLQWKFSGTSGAVSGRVDDADGNSIASFGGSSSVGLNSKTITIPTGKTGVKVKFFSAAIGSYSDFEISIGLTAPDYTPYNGQIKTITLDTTVSSGSIDFAHGTITDSGNVIKFTPVTLDAVAGENNVYIDVGNMNTLTYVSQADLGLMALLEAYTKR